MRYILFICLISIVNSCIFGQANLIEYYNNFNNSLLSDSSNYSDIKVYESKYKNGQIKQLCAFVKLKSDSVDRYWHLGKCLNFYKNGNLKFVHCIDTDFNDSDTSLSFDKSGQLVYVQIYKDIKEYKDLPIIDTSFYGINSKITVDYVFIDRGNYFSKSIEKEGFGQYYSNFTDRYKQVIYKSSKKYFEGIFINSPLEKKYRAVTAIEYNSDGSIRFKPSTNDTVINKIQVSTNQINWKQIKFNNNNSKEINNYVLNYINGFKGLFPSKLTFERGYIIFNKDSINCYIYTSIEEKQNKTMNPFLNTFILTISDTIFSVYTSKDIVTYGYSNRKFVRLALNEQYIFVEEIALGKINLYQCYQTPIDPDFSYFIRLMNSSSIYQFKPFKESLPKEGQAGSAIMDYQSQTINTFSLQHDILKFLLTLPEIDDNFRNKVKSGFWSINDIDKFVKEYNKK